MFVYAPNWAKRFVRKVAINGGNRHSRLSMPQFESQIEISRAEDFGLVADHKMLRRTAIALLLLGGLLEGIYISFFNPPDWSDALAAGFVAVAVLVSALLPFDRVSERWILIPFTLGLAAVVAIAVGDKAVLGVSFFFLPAAVMMVFFWDDLVTAVPAMLMICVLYVAVPAISGDRDALIESVATLPLLVTGSLLLGMLFKRFRGASVEQARFRGTITALLMALEARDGHTAEHSSEVLTLVMAVAEDLGLEPKDQLHVADVALLHDVGKIGIPNEILYKPDSLTDDEWDVMKRHPEIGERILREVPGFETVATAVRHEHERWDGLGYPDGKQGTEIPLASRIVLVCDAYHAMVSKRPYRAPMSDDAARDQLLRNAGTQFDPAVVDSLLAVLERQNIDRLRRRAADVAEKQSGAAVGAARSSATDKLLSSFSKRTASF